MNGVGAAPRRALVTSTRNVYMPARTANRGPEPPSTAAGAHTKARGDQSGSRSWRSGAFGSSSLGTNGGRPSTADPATASRSVEVSTILGSHGSAARSLARSTPLPSGSSTSTRIAAGRSASATDNPSATVAAVPETGPPASSRIRLASDRNTGSSSTTSTDPAMGLIIAGHPVGEGRDNPKPGSARSFGGY